MSINRAMISGNLTRDADLRSTQGGMAIMGFGVAVNDRRKNQQTGEWEDYPNFVDCTMFGTRAEKLQPYMTKGTKVAVEGKLRYSSWEQEGQRRSKLEVIVDEIEFMSSRQQDAPQQYAPQGYQPQAYAPQAVPQQAYAPQAAPQQYAPQGYQNPPAAPQQPRQAPAPAPQAYAPQAAPQPVVAAAPQQASLYDEEIPF